jgi:hypothetical protein
MVNKIFTQIKHLLILKLLNNDASNIDSIYASLAIRKNYLPRRKRTCGFQLILSLMLTLVIVIEDTQTDRQTHTHTHTDRHTHTHTHGGTSLPSKNGFWVGKAD